MAKTTVTLQTFDESNDTPARKMHKMTLKLSHLPRVGDMIKDSDFGYAEVVKVVFDTQDNITLVIK